MTALREISDRTASELRRHSEFYHGIDPAEYASSSFGYDQMLFSHAYPYVEPVRRMIGAPIKMVDEVVGGPRWSVPTPSSLTGFMNLLSVISVGVDATTATPGWLDDQERIDRLTGYDKYETPDWDGYGANPISSETRLAARNFLDCLPRSFQNPDIAPGSDGTIALEWAFNDGPLRKLFIDIGPGALWRGYWRRASGDVGNLAPLKMDRDLRFSLARLARQLSA